MLNQGVVEPYHGIHRSVLQQINRLCVPFVWLSWTLGPLWDGMIRRDAFRALLKFSGQDRRTSCLFSGNTGAGRQEGWWNCCSGAHCWLIYITRHVAWLFFVCLFVFSDSIVIAPHFRSYVGDHTGTHRFALWLVWRIACGSERGAN